MTQEIKIKTNTNRCTICNIKVKLDGWNCKCDTSFLFCDKHRLPFDHNCTYNFKKDYSVKLKISNLKCIKQKVEQIQ